MPASLDVDSISVSLGGKTILKDLALHVKAGSLACLVGPSGCGKSTTLRAIAGFETLLDGEIRVDGRVVSSRARAEPPERRQIGMVFQENALFPHLDVASNVGFGLRGMPRSRAKRVVDELLDVVGLRGMEARYPHELSGGQQQRVALARSLAPSPKLLLLDEPFSSLDTDLRLRLAGEVRAILLERGITTILVTHDQHEAFALADQIAVMRDGRILQWDTAYNLYHEPRDRFVAGFVGPGVFLRGKLVSPTSVDTELGVLVGNRAYGWPVGCEVDVLLRPEDIVADPASDILATVHARAFMGAQIQYTFKLATGSLIVGLFSSHLDFAEGAPVRIGAAIDHLVAFRTG